MSGGTESIDKFSMAHKWSPETPMKLRDESKHHQICRSLSASVGATSALGDARIVVFPDSFLRCMILHSASAINEAQVSNGVVVTRTGRP
jgi:hypothetical protein